jgi:hypothetical protein
MKNDMTNQQTSTPTSSAVVVGEVTANNVSATLPKGGSASQIPEHVLVLDTGQPIPPPAELQTPRTQADVDTLYRLTIASGIVDHHSIDATVPAFPPGCARLSTTGMIASFPLDVLDLVKQRGKVEVTAHIDSDLDSMAASYLARALVQYQTIDALPQMADRLGEYVNQVDFGRERMPLNADRSPNVEAFAKSLSGVFCALKTSIDRERQNVLGPIFADKDKSWDEKKVEIAAVNEIFQRELTARSFELLNRCEDAFRVSSGTLDFRNISLVVSTLSEETMRHIEAGSASFAKDMGVLKAELERSTRKEVQVRTKGGELRHVELIVIPQTALHPLQAANLVDYFVGPDAITAVYAGPNRTKGGDAYDIRVRPETVEMFDLKELELPLNRAEAKRREPELASLRAKVSEGTATADEQKLLSTWETPRQGFQHLGHGDPTVCVAGGSLIAASSSSRLTSDDFVRAIFEHFGV